MRRLVALASVCSFLALAGTVRPARADVCTSSEPSCGDGTCCAASDVCGPSAADGCCSGATPYCCGGGACAVSASECSAAAGDASTSCNAYDVPCGDGCVAAGSDCCDGAGHYCAPGVACASEATCSDGTRAALVPTRATTETSPLTDPPDAVSRSCAMAPGPSASALWPIWALGVAALVRARRSRR
jgi:MYXO-CTERM domain-containing protein